MNSLAHCRTTVAYASSFIIQTASSILAFAIPICAFRLGAPSLVIGLIGTGGGVTYTVTAIMMGRVSDRLSRKGILLVASVLLAVDALSYLLVQNYLLLIPLAAMQSLALGAFWPSLECFIMGRGDHTVNVALRGFNLSWSLGWIVGPPLGGMFISRFPPSFLFYCTFILFIGGFFLLATLPGDSPRSKKAEIANKASKHIWSSLASFGVFYTLTFVYSFTTHIHTSLFPAYAVSLGLDPIVVGEIMFFLGMARTAAFSLTNTIERTLGNAVIFVGPSLLTVAMAVIFVSQETWHLALACSILGLGAGISYSTSLSAILGKADLTLGLRAGLFEGIIGTGSTLGPLLAGLVSVAGPTYPYALASLACIPIIVYSVANTLGSRCDG